MRLLLAIAALLWAVCLGSAAWAHAALVSVEPRDGSVLAAAPKTVALHFNEPVTAGAVQLIDAEGKLRGDASVAADGAVIKLSLPESLPNGTSVVSYRVISADGHPVAGTVTFSVGAPTATKPPDSSGAATAVAVWLARVCLYIGLFGGIGGVFFVRWIARREAARAFIGATLISGLVGAALSIGLQGLDVLGLPLAALTSATPWRIALDTSLGPSMLIAIAALLAAAVALRIESERLARGLSAAALAGVGVALATSGHAATATPQLLTRPAVGLHVVAVAFWLGALMPLAALVGREKHAALPVVRRFSSAAIAVVGILVATGLALAVVQLGSFAALIDTAYGALLLLKLTIVAVLLTLAALNRFRFTPALDHGDARSLRRSILLECVAGVAILGVVAGWRFTPPPRSIVPETPLAVHIHTDKAMFQVLISPGKVGSDNFVLQLMDGEGTPLAAKEATLAVSLPAGGIEDIERTGVLGSDGFWHVDNVPLTMAGRWHMRIGALVTDFEKITLEDDFDITGR